MASILIVGLRGFGIARSRGLLIRRLREQGHGVAVFANRDGAAAEIEAIEGVEFTDAGFSSATLAPATDARAIGRLEGVFRSRQPALVHFFNAKPTLLGLVALHRSRASTRVICTVTGLGRAFADNPVLRLVASVLYRRLLRRAGAVIFQNPDDRDYFVAHGLVEASRARLIVGSGVDTERFHPSPVAEPRPVTVLMASRLLRSKGLLEYFEVARRVRAGRPAVRFLLAGEAVDDHPDAIREVEASRIAADSGVEWLGYRADMPELLRQVDLLVHPAIFREGLPRVVIEAAASGVAAITTDLPGCRAAIVPDVTGLLVPPREPAAIAAGIAALADDRTRLAAMGAAARRLAEEQFDLRAIVEAQLALYDEVLGGSAPA